MEAQKRLRGVPEPGHAIFAESDKPTVSDVLDFYLKNHKPADPDRQKAAVRLLKAHFGDTPLCDVKIPACRAYCAARKAGVVRSQRAGASDATLRRELTVLKAAAAFAVKWEKATAADMPVVELPAEERGAQETGWLTKEQIAALIEAAEGDLKDFIVLAYWWGRAAGMGRDA